MNLIGKSAFSATRELIDHFGSTFTLGRRRQRLERADHTPVRNTRFSRRRRANSFFSSVDNPGWVPSSISAWATHLRRPETDIPSRRATADSDSSLSRTRSTARRRNSSESSSRHQIPPFPRDKQPLTRSQNTCPQKRGNSINLHPLKIETLRKTRCDSARKCGCLRGKSLSMI